MRHRNLPCISPIACASPSRRQGLTEEEAAQTLAEINAADGLEEVTDSEASPSATARQSSASLATSGKINSAHLGATPSEKKRAIRRRTLVDYMLRDGVPDYAAPAKGGGNAEKPTPARHLGEVVTAHVYVEEEDDALAADHDIIGMMLTELCKCVHGLRTAFHALLWPAMA